MGNKYKTLDSLISKYVRIRDTKKDGFIRCFICGQKISYLDAQNCHYIPRQYISTRFNLINCNAGCISCNCFDSEHEKRYRTKLVKVYGEEIVLQLEEQKHKTCKLSKSDILFMEKMMREKIKELEFIMNNNDSKNE